MIGRAKKQIEAQIRFSYEKGLEKKADVLRLLHTLYRKHPRKWKEFRGEGNDFPLHKDSLRDIRIEIELNFEGKTNESLENST